MDNKNLFFFDIFNKILLFNDEDIFIIFDKDGVIWFGYVDLIRALEYSKIEKARKTLKIDPEYKKNYGDIVVTKLPENININKLKPNKIFINESGLYQLMGKSTKPLAKLFMDKYFKDIMPQIRKTGNYIGSAKDKQEIKKLNDKIDNYKKELNYFDDKYEFEPSNNGYFYVSEDTITDNGKKETCYKIGYCKNIKTRIQNYKVGNFNFNLLFYIPLTIDSKSLEKCIKNKLNPHLLKIKTDTICYVSLKELKKNVIDCIEETKEHICHCVYCKKKYEFSNVSYHKCYKNLENKIIDVKKIPKNKKTNTKK